MENIKNESITHFVIWITTIYLTNRKNTLKYRYFGGKKTRWCCITFTKRQPPKYCWLFIRQTVNIRLFYCLSLYYHKPIYRQLRSLLGVAITQPKVSLLFSFIVFFFFTSSMQFPFFNFNLQFWQSSNCHSIVVIEFYAIEYIGIIITWIYCSL